MTKELFVGVTEIIRNGPSHFAKVVIQPPFGSFPGMHPPFLSIDLPIKSISLTPEEISEIENLVRGSVDWDAISSWASSQKP